MNEVIQNVPLRDRLIAEQIIKNLQTADGKWRTQFDVLRNVSFFKIETAMNVLNLLVSIGVIRVKVENVPAPVTTGRIRRMIKVKEYRLAKPM